MSSVTIVAHDVGPMGGMERVLHELIKGLVAAGDRVTVIARTCDLKHADVTFYRVPGPKRPFVVAYPWFFLAGGALLLRHREGVVQATGAIVPNRVDVISVHFCHRGFGAKSSVVRSSRGGLLYRTHARLAAVLSRMGESFCFRPSRVSALIAVSRGVAGELRLHYPAVADAVAVIPNGVDVERFSPRPLSRHATRSRLGLTDDALVALFVGGDWERKGLAVAIDAVARCSGWILVVAGTGDDKHYAATAERLGVANRIRFLGQVTDIASVYQAADVLVLPTAYEADPLVALEAAATGLPVLATRVNGIVDLIRDNVSGYLIDRAAPSIALHLSDLEADRTVLVRMSTAAHIAARGRSWRAVVRQYRALYSAMRPSVPT